MRSKARVIRTGLVLSVVGLGMVLLATFAAALLKLIGFILMVGGALVVVGGLLGWRGRIYPRIVRTPRPR